MRNFTDSLRKLGDQLLTEAGGTPDRPTSLYSAGTVGGQTPRRREAEQDITDLGPPRQREFRAEPMPTDVEDRRSRPVVQQRRAPIPQRMPIRDLVRSPGSLRAAIVISEVLGPPVSLREERR